MLTWNKEAWWYDHVPSDQVQEDIYSALKGNLDEPMTTADLAEVTDYTQRKINEALKPMVKDGKVKKIPRVISGNGSQGNGYRLPSDGSNEYGGLAV